MVSKFSNKSTKKKTKKMKHGKATKYDSFHILKTQGLKDLYRVYL